MQNETQQQLEDSSRSGHTSSSLLHGIREGNADQWRRFVLVCGPLVHRWCRRSGVPEEETRDVVQDVMRAVVTSIADFHREDSGDSFHGWLWGITRHKVLDFYRELEKREVAVGGSTVQERITKTPSEIPKQWEQSDQADDQNFIYHRTLNLIQTEFEPHTWQAFWCTVVEEKRAADVAEDLRMTTGAVYNARYKVLRRLRVEFTDMFELRSGEK